MTGLIDPWSGLLVVSGGVVATTTYDPAHTSANITLSNGNLTIEIIAGSANGDSSRSIAHHASGLYYTETSITQEASDGVAVGVCNSSFNVTNTGLGTDANGAGYYPDGNIYGNTGGGSLLNTGVTYTNGDRIGVEVNATGQTMRVRKNGGAYSSTASLSFITGDFYFAGFVFKTGALLGKHTTNFGGAAYTDSPGAASNW